MAGNQGAMSGPLYLMSACVAEGALITDKDGTRSQNVAGRNHRSHPGAPAPAILVEDVIEASSALGPVELTTLPGVGENVEFKLPAERNG
jgi:hypothetical protein